MTDLILVRHGETEWNAERRVQGSRDSRLSALGLLQAEAVAERLAAWPVTAVYSSDLKRAVITAQRIASRRNLPVVQMGLLRERSFGVLEGLTEEQIRAEHPDAWRCYWVDKDPDYAIAGAETWADVGSRMSTAIRQIITAHPNDTDQVVVVGHGGSLRTVILVAIGARLSSMRRISISNASITIVRYNSEGARVLVMNDTCHDVAPEVEVIG